MIVDLAFFRPEPPLPVLRPGHVAAGSSGKLQAEDDEDAMAILSLDSDRVQYQSDGSARTIGSQAAGGRASGKKHKHQKKKKKKTKRMTMKMSMKMATGRAREQSGAWMDGWISGWHRLLACVLFFDFDFDSRPGVLVPSAASSSPPLPLPPPR